MEGHNLDKCTFFYGSLPVTKTVVQFTGPPSARESAQSSPLSLGHRLCTSTRPCHQDLGPWWRCRRVLATPGLPNSPAGTQPSELIFPKHESSSDGPLLSPPRTPPDGIANKSQHPRPHSAGLAPCSPRRRLCGRPTPAGAPRPTRPARHPARTGRNGASFNAPKMGRGSVPTTGQSALVQARQLCEPSLAPATAGDQVPEWTPRGDQALRPAPCRPALLLDPLFIKCRTC